MRSRGGQHLSRRLEGQRPQAGERFLALKARRHRGQYRCSFAPVPAVAIGIGGDDRGGAQPGAGQRRQPNDDGRVPLREEVKPERRSGALSFLYLVCLWRRCVEVRRRGRVQQIQKVLGRARCVGCGGAAETEGRPEGGAERGGFKRVRLRVREAGEGGRRAWSQGCGRAGHDLRCPRGD